MLKKTFTVGPLSLYLKIMTHVTLIIGIWFKIAVLQVSLSVAMGLCEAEGHMLLALMKSTCSLCCHFWPLLFLWESVCVCVCDVTAREAVAWGLPSALCRGSLHFLHRDWQVNEGWAGPSESCTVGSTALRAAPLGQCSLYSHLRQCVCRGWCWESLLSKSVPFNFVYQLHMHRNN